MLKNFIQENKDDAIFARNSYRRFTIMSIALLIINFALLGFLFWKQTHVIIPPDFATTSDGRLIDISPIK